MCKLPPEYIEPKRIDDAVWKIIKARVPYMTCQVRAWLDSYTEDYLPDVCAFLRAYGQDEFTVSPERYREAMAEDRETRQLEKAGL